MARGKGHNVNKPAGRGRGINTSTQPLPSAIASTQPSPAIPAIASTQPTPAIPATITPSLEATPASRRQTSESSNPISDATPTSRRRTAESSNPTITPYYTPSMDAMTGLGIENPQIPCTSPISSESEPEPEFENEHDIDSQNISTGSGSTDHPRATDGRYILSWTKKDGFEPDMWQIGHTCMEVFQRYPDAMGSEWRLLCQQTKDLYFREFEKIFTWDPSQNGIMRKAWNQKAGRRYSGFIYNIKHERVKTCPVPAHILEEWRKAWGTEAAKKLSKQQSKNRMSELAGPGTGPSTHTYGSKSMKQHAKDLAAANGGKFPGSFALFKHSHTSKQDREKFVDKRSEIVADNYNKLKESSQSTQGPNGEEEQSSKNDDDLFLEAAGGSKKARIYGLGNVGTSRILKGSGSTSQSVNESMLTEIREEICNEISNKVSHMETKLESKIAEMTRFLVDNQTWFQNMLLGRATEPPRWVPTEPTPPA